MADLQVPVAGRAPVLIPAAELRWRFSRSSGPGGQNVNRTDSRAQLLWDLAASEALTPVLRARALRRLELLQEALLPPPPPRRATKPTRGSVQRRLAAKQRRSALKRLRAECQGRG